MWLSPRISSMAFVWNSFLLIQMYVLIALPAAENRNTKGRAFMVSFLKNFGSDSQNSIIITTEQETRVYVYVPSTASLLEHFLRANSSIYLKLPPETTVSSWGTPERKAVSVYSTELVSVYGVTSRHRSSGGYLALPVDKWSVHYIVATYDGFQNSGGEIVIISAADNTSISVWLNVVKLTRCVAKERTVDRSTLLSFSMNREDVLRIACDDDLTGSVIKGSKPIAVISGNACTQVPKNVPHCDHLVEMMIPTTSLGRDYIVAPLGGKDTIFRVIYTDDTGPTNLTMEPVGADVTVNTANRLYKEYTVSPPTIVSLHASIPVLVVLYSLSTNNASAYGDPSMVLLVPIERYDSEYNVDCSWKTLPEMSDFTFDVNVYSPGNVSNPFAPHVGVLPSASVSGFTVSHADITNSCFLTQGSFIPDSNIIFSASALGTTAAFPIGMKLEFFTGADNCSASPCLNHGICYTHGPSLACYCGDQLSGDRCENDILNACSSFPCQNNSTCIDLAYKFKCVCQHNFTGDFCETELKVMTTSKPKTTTSKLKITTSKPKTTTSKPKITSKPKTTTSKPKLTTSKPKTTTSKPKITTSKPKTTVVRETEMCTCTCENVTAEEIQDKKVQIKKELTVDAKGTNKNKIRYTSAYDTRPSATGIGIVGILFLVLVFGCFMALDLITAATYIVIFIRNRKKPNTSEKYDDYFTKNIALPSQVNCYNNSTKSDILQSSVNTATGSQKLPPDVNNSVGDKSELVVAPDQYSDSLDYHSTARESIASKTATKEIRNPIPASADSKLDLLYAKSCSQPFSYIHSVISFPRFQTDADKILVLGEDGKTFRIRKCSWSFRQQVETQTCHSSDATRKENEQGKSTSGD